MSQRLTKLQKQLCNALQEGLPICSRPFAEIAGRLNSDGKSVLQQTRELKRAGVIRRISALLNYRALGKVSTLVTAHVPKEALHRVTEAVNSLENVSHNYLRKHHYNLWFTLQAESAEQIEAALAALSKRFGIAFNSLPAQRVFKLDVCFDAEDEGQLFGDVLKVSKSKIVKLTDDEKLILSKLQNELEVTAKPFDFLCGESLGQQDVLDCIAGLVDKNVVRRIAAVVDHRRLGFVANVLFAGEVPERRIVEVGKALARFRMVSHCYQRKTFGGWPYNLFAMMHSRNISQIRQAIEKFVESEKISSFELLPTKAKLKKQPVKHRFF